MTQLSQGVADRVKSMPGVILRGVAALVFAAISFTLHASEGANESWSGAVEATHLLTYSGALVEFDKPVIDLGKKVSGILEDRLNGKVVMVDDAVKVLAGDGEYKVLHRPRIATGAGFPGEAGVFMTDYKIYATAGGGKFSTKLLPLRTGYKVTLHPLALPAATEDKSGSFFTRFEVEHSGKAVNGGGVVATYSEGEAPMKEGDVQVAAWVSESGQFALVLRLDSVLSLSQVQE